MDGDGVTVTSPRMMLWSHDSYLDEDISSVLSSSKEKKIMRRKVENKAEQITVQLCTSVVLPSLESRVQVWPSCCKQDTLELDKLQEDVQNMKRLLNGDQLSIRGLFSLEKNLGKCNSGVPNHAGSG